MMPIVFILSIQNNDLKDSFRRGYMETNFKIFDPPKIDDIRKHCRFRNMGLSPAVICLLYDFPPTKTYMFNVDSKGTLSKDSPFERTENDANRKIGYSGENYHK